MPGLPAGRARDSRLALESRRPGRNTGGVAAAPAEQTEASAHRERDGLTLGVQAVDLIVGMDAGERQDDHADRQTRHHEAHDNLHQPPWVETGPRRL